MFVLRQRKSSKQRQYFYCEPSKQNLSRVKVPVILDNGFTLVNTQHRSLKTMRLLLGWDEVIAR